MQITTKPLDGLKPYEKNPRKNDKAVEMVVKSIKEFGFKVPIVVDKQNVIVAGHTRYKAAKELGMAELPCIVADDLTPEQIKAFRIADNRTADYSTWDFPALVNEIMDLHGAFDDILNVADFDGIMEEFDDLTAEAREAGALMSSEYCLTVVFADEESRDAAKQQIKGIEGCLDVRVKR
jgi:hypothetical protein